MLSEQKLKIKQKYICKTSECLEILEIKTMIISKPRIKKKVTKKIKRYLELGEMGKYKNKLFKRKYETLAQVKSS